MLQEISRYIPDQLYNFISSQRCCQNFCGSFRSTERVIFSEYAAELGFYTRNHIKNGMQTVTVFKRFCTHHIEAERLIIQRQSAKELFLLFSLHLQNEFIGRLQEMQISPDYFSPTNGSCPFVAPCRFSSGSFKQSIPMNFSMSINNNHAYGDIMSCKEDIIRSITHNRVLVVSGEYHFQKSKAIPMFLLEKCAQKRIHCKIICVELNELLAAPNCDIVAKQLGDKIGENVSYQVNCESFIKETSNIIYTTAAFLLRVLMGQKIVDSLHHVSHIIVNDIHMRQADSDLLLSELRLALTCYSELRVILLSNSCQNSIFLEYFNEGEEIKLGSNTLRSDNQSLKIFYIEEIREILEENCYKSLVYNTPPNVVRDFDCNEKNIDSCLEVYEEKGTDQAIDDFLHMVHGEFASIDSQHSLTETTALIIAAKLGKLEHIRLLLQLHANPYILDIHKQNALQHAIYCGNDDCVELLRVYYKTIGNNHSDSNADYFDCSIISNLIHLITIYPEWPAGNILVFVPNYEQLVRVNFSLLRLKLIGKLSPHINIRILHDNLGKDELYNLLNSSLTDIEIIISTNIGETFPNFKGITYIIDTARNDGVTYNASADCNENKFKWNSQESIQNRSLIIDKNSFENGICFRLLPRSLYSQLPPVNTPELLTMPLDRVCLTVKLLSPYTMIAEYLQRTIARPPFIHVHQTVEHLKRIEVLDSFEDITWLGCRLIDIPIECYLGKLLIFGILFHCFDPILTVVSFLTRGDPLELPRKKGCMTNTHINTIRFKIKEERKRLAGSHFSDHLILLRLFQEWQNGIPDNGIDTFLVDEHDFVMNAILENVAATRTHLVASLRLAQLIHNQYPLNMQSLNLHSNNWSIIKAALVGGLYPKLCVVDASVFQIKSGRNKKLMIYPSSVLRDFFPEPLNVIAQKFISPWIVYSKEVNTITSNSIENCTLVAPLAVIMFAGPSKIYNENVETFKVGDHLNKESKNESTDSNGMISNFYIDEWIWCTMDATDTQLILKTRQLFFSIFNFYLQTCTTKDRPTGQNVLVTQLPRLLDTLAKVLLNEDISYGFNQPERVGDRPKAKPINFLSTHNATLSSNKGYNRLPYNKKEQQFFILRLPDSTDTESTRAQCEWLNKIAQNTIAPNISTDKLTYLITYKRNPDYFDTISVANFLPDRCEVQQCFKNKIPIFDLINICLRHNILLPLFNERRIAFHIDNQIGQIILDLFAFRDNLFHNH